MSIVNLFASSGGIKDQDLLVKSLELQDGDMKLNDGDIKLEGPTSAVYNKQFIFNYAPDVVNTIFTQYIGTVNLQGVVEIKLQDSGFSYGGASIFRVSRCAGNDPVVFRQHSGTTVNNFYTIFFRSIDAFIYELFFTTNNTTTTQTINFNVLVTTRANLTDNISALDDVNIFQCEYALASFEGGSVAFGKPNPDINFKIDVAGEIKVLSSGQVGSVGNILIDSGVKTWASGIDIGVDPLVITGLDGNSHGGYIIKFSVDAQPTNQNNFLLMTLNGDTTNVYSNRIVRDGASVINNNSQPNWNFIRPNLGISFIGNGTFDLWADKSSILSNTLNMNGKWASQGLVGVDPFAYYTGYGYISADSTNITTMTIDIVNVNHTGWQLNYFIWRYK